MSVDELSSSAQDYLKALWGLQEWRPGPVAASALAQRLGLRASTVSDAVRRLTEQGLVDHAPYGGISLTAGGRELALTMVRRHRLLETFLVEILGYGWQEVHDEAERLEHAVSDDLIRRIDAHLHYPRRDPHGDPIPSADLRVEVPAAEPLQAWEPLSEVTVERISDSDPALLQHFSHLGIGVGTQLRVLAPDPYGAPVAVEPITAPGTVLPLSAAAAAAVWASRSN